jgi:hypothetical protein
MCVCVYVRAYGTNSDSIQIQIQKTNSADVMDRYGRTTMGWNGNGRGGCGREQWAPRKDIEREKSLVGR